MLSISAAVLVFVVSLAESKLPPLTGQLKSLSWKEKVISLLSSDYEGVVGFDDSITEDMAQEIYFNELLRIEEKARNGNNNNNKNESIPTIRRRREVDANTGDLDDADRQALLDRHNEYRIALSSPDGTVIQNDGSVYPGAANMNFLFWDDALAAVSQGYAETLASACAGITHNGQRTNDFYTYSNLATFTYPANNIYLGENIGVTITSGSVAKLSRYTNRLKQMWNEQTLWSYQTFSSGSTSGVGHFTQIAWAKTRYIGCGAKKCYPDASGKNRYYIVCNYWPGGNYNNQEVYEDGTCTPTNNECPADRTNPGEDSLCAGCMDADFSTGSTNNAVQCTNGLGVSVGVAVGNQPSFSPSNEPSGRPTGNPTNKPTDRPTNNPTDKPTDRPTPNPTNRPTNNPTPRPTNRPTRDPTPRPTGLPTDKPTVRPTNNPTNRPTGNPTNKPTPRPTGQPTDKPTDRPTNNPTDRPTDSPTDKPTTPEPTNNPLTIYTPTKNPTPRPTNRPTEDPTNNPSDRPTTSPTDKPTNSPTDRPTNSPSDKPTDRPTDGPTNKPTPRPSDNPTDRPTPMPTRRPSENPTDRPSVSPTEKPTNRPTENPTDKPTNRPTENPTNRPTSDPTPRPTNRPTNNPTPRPTSNPTLRPTNNPTDRPTTASPTEASTLDPIIIQRQSSTHSWYVRFKLLDVTSGVTIEKVETRDVGTDSPQWQANKPPAWETNCQHNNDVWQTCNQIGRPWYYPLDVRITTTDGRVLTTENILGEGNSGDQYDFGQNFAGSGAISVTSVSTNVVMYSLIGVGVLLFLLIGLWVLIKRVRERKESEKDSEEEVATAIEITSPTYKANKPNETDAMTPHGNSVLQKFSGFPGNNPAIVAHESADIVYDKQIGKRQTVAAGETQSLKNTGENSNSNSNEKEDDLKDLKISMNGVNSGNPVTAGVDTNGTEIVPLASPTTPGQKRKRPRVKSIHLEETMTYYGDDANNNDGAPVNALPHAIATPTNDAPVDGRDRFNSDIGAPLTPLMQAMKGYQTEELSLSTQQQQQQLQHGILSPSKPNGGFPKTNIMGIIEAGDSTEEDDI